MTEQEIEKLRGKLGDGFEVTEGYNCAVITVKDIWKGVEFASHIFCDEVYRVSEIIGDNIWNTKGTWLPKIASKRSTEAAYVEQLKAKAHELYGEIKGGDRFDVSIFGGHEYVSVGNSNIGFTYLKLDDKLYFGDIPIYQQGKWAKKVEEPIRVSAEGCNIDSGVFYLTLNERAKEEVRKVGAEHVNRKIAKVLEELLKN